MSSLRKNKSKDNAPQTTTINNIRLTTNASIDSKIPKGATILDKKIDISIEQIENGYITTKTFDYKYQVPGKEYSDWAYHTLKFYTEEMPIELTVAASDDSDGDGKTLADLFDS